ncbi:MAG: adenylate/guanylate cyclase domain-containing protein [Saprospiraceae bacterium]
MKSHLTHFAITAIFSVCSWQSINAQNLDSLWNAWQDETHVDTIRLEAIHKFTVNGYLYSHPDSAYYFAQLQYDFAQSKGLKKQMARALNLQGRTFAIKDDYPKVLDYYQRSLKIKEEIRDKSGIASSLNNIGIIYARLGDNLRALDYYQQSLKIKEEIGDKGKIASSLNNIGTIYGQLDNGSRAIDYYRRSLSSFDEIGDKKGIATSLMNIGLVYSQLSDYSKAIDYYRRSLSSFDEIGDKKGIAYSLMNIGLVYSQLNDYPKAIDYSRRSLLSFEEIGDKRGTATSLGSIGTIYRIQGDYQKALDFCQKGLEQAQEIKILDRQKKACQCLFDTYKALGNSDEALVYMEKMRAVEDSLQTEETVKKLEQMEFEKIMLQDSITKAEEARLIQAAHEAEIRKRNLTRNWMIGGGILVLLLAAGFYNRWRYTRKSRDIISKEKDRFENLLLNILPAEVAKELKEKGKADARDFDGVSVLFTDFISFTEISEKLTASELVDEINHCFEAFDGITEKYGIEKIKTIGDAYMAVGGLPVPTDNSTKNTVLAALEMQDFISNRKAILSAVEKSGFEMRLGIHTGPVIAGIVGIKKFQYDIWGDTVNTASRIESLGEAKKVNISHSTYILLKNDSDFVFESRGKIEAKGKGKIEMYFVSSA